jgi:hypothetical protein
MGEAALQSLADSYGVSEALSGYGYPRLLRYERREREAVRQRRAEERGACEEGGGTLCGIIDLTRSIAPCPEKAGLPSRRKWRKNRHHQNQPQGTTAAPPESPRSS